MSGQTRLLRPVVAASWQRSSALDPDRLPSVAVDGGAIDELRAAHPLAAVLPVVRKLLLQSTEGSGLLVAIGDADGRLLWVEGDHGALDAAERMRFVAGADWAERRVGTSAPGTALVLDRAVQIRGDEHWATMVKTWSCTAVPIHDTDSGRVLGVLDLTGDTRAVGEHALPLLTATGVAMEAELALERIRREARRSSATRPPVRRAVRPTSRASTGSDTGARDTGARDSGARDSGARDSGARVELLGTDDARIHVGDRRAVVRARHSEILAVLSVHPAGLSARALAEAVYGDEDAVVTLRAELVRLRHVLADVDPELAPASRPYRFTVPVGTDVQEVLALLDRGSRLAAIRAYRGPVLPSSRAPGVEALRERVRGRISEAVTEDGSVDALVAWTATECGSADVAALRALLTQLPARSPRRAGVVATLADLGEA
jgi:transcriptional regulator of acetoin/glycerol metabolism